MLKRFHAMNKVKAHPVLPQSESGSVNVGSVQRGYNKALIFTFG